MLLAWHSGMAVWRIDKSRTLNKKLDPGGLAQELHLVPKHTPILGTYIQPTVPTGTRQQTQLPRIV